MEPKEPVLVNNEPTESVVLFYESELTGGQ